MDDSDLVRGMGMGIVAGGGAVGRPARMGDPDNAWERLLRELAREIVELPLGAAPFQSPVDDGAKAGRIIAPIFEPPQALERSEEHTSELQSLMRISFAVFCL